MAQATADIVSAVAFELAPAREVTGLAKIGPVCSGSVSDKAATWNLSGTTRENKTPREGEDIVTAAVTRHWHVSGAVIDDDTLLVPYDAFTLMFAW
jgi:hypothetical protein